MELLEGQSLNDRLAGKPIPISELLDLGAQTCAALQAAHGKGIVHRDIKPANIFLSNNGQIKILDFGLAKLVEETHPAATNATFADAGAEFFTDTFPATGAGRLMGTPAYLSPEQARAEEVDARTDIFSFGLVLFEMATGRPTFLGQTSEKLINAILQETPVKPSTLNPAVPSSLDGIILKALEKPRDARYQSAAELLRDLQELQKARQRRPVRLSWIIPAAATLVLSAALVAGIISSKRSVSEAPALIQRQITSNPVNDSVYMAAISADGKELAYTDLRGVHVQTLDTGEVHDIPLPPGLCFR
jgi:serine/threonine protein kinase